MLPIFAKKHDKKNTNNWGTGFIGNKINNLLAQRNSNFSIYISSRKPKGTNQIYINLNEPKTLIQITKNSIDLVVLCTIDKKNSLLNFCIENHINYIDITQPSEYLQNSHTHLKNKKINSRIIFSSGWMSGIIGGLIDQNLKNKIKEILLFIYYSSKDQSGASSAHFIAENINKKYPVYINNEKQHIKNFQHPKIHEFDIFKKKSTTYSFEIPDLYILNQIEQITTVTSQVTFESKMTTRLVVLLQKVHFFKLFPFKIRKKIFTSNHQRDQTLFDIAITQQNGISSTISVQSIKGQGELTAFSTVLHIEKLFSHPPEVYFSHQLYDNLELSKSLQQNTSIIIK